ncbi:glycosyltransferase family 2 protein [Bacillus sp. REN10]|uniref:glycosyltransferase family 2 protein n=1 Tax=Bacillus sp. REN10 TaxID=2782541 RepID=UPI0023B15B61|nr:glycosyltransferase family 2 protein [Bacillus sp. REN10]
MPKVSIIMPVFNKESRLKYSINSVLNQTYQNFELIIINDGSTDHSSDVIIQYKNKDSRIVYIEQENKGVSMARNLGIRQSKAEYVTFLDADDELDPAFLEKMLSKIGNSNVCCCFHHYIINGTAKKARMKFFEGDILEKYLYNICTPNTNSWLMKRNYLDENNILFSPEVNWGEDMVFFSKVLLHDKNVKCVPEYLTNYHYNSANSLSENNIDKIDKDLRWMNDLKKYIAMNEQNVKRKKNCIEAIDAYRIPGAIIYRMYTNVGVIDRKQLKQLVPLYEKYTKKIKISNGVRSLKLIYYRKKFLKMIG